VISPVRLADICSEVSYGFTASATDENTGTRFLRITDIQGGKVDWEIVPFCEIDAKSKEKNLLQENDIVVARTGNSTGENYLFSSTVSAVFASYLIRFRVDSTAAHPKFVWYQMRSKKWWDFISGAKTGSAQAGANAKVLGSFEVHLPAKTDQKAIAHILGTLDDKIEINQKMNQTLEEIAKAIFKSWFVDFDPVRAKAEGRPTGLPPEIRDLFPDELVDSEIGEIPKGWILEEGRHLYSHQKGLSYKGKYLSDEDHDLPMLNLGSFAGNGKYRREKLKFYCGEFKERHQIYKGELLVANTDLTQDRLVIGSPILVPETPNESDFYIHTHHTTKITPNEEKELTTVFIYFTFLQDSFRKRVSGFATGTTVLALPKDTFDALQVIIPPAPLRTKFEEIATPILDRCSLLAKEIEVLSKLRDTLLPKLISGELRIPDAEKFLEEAGI
jgi:type I restriction enzyme S subunit